MAATNFANEHFKTIASSDKVTVDGFEAPNLVRDSSSLYGCKGFLVENFVRSPTNIKFEFALNIEVEKIVIHGVVGAQRACGYEIFTHSQNKGGNQLLFSNDHWSSKMETTADSTMDDRVFQSVGKFNKLEAETFTFRNHRFRPRRPHSILARMPEKLYNGGKHEEAELRARNMKNLTHVSHLIIRVNRVVPGCVAAIRWVEIWGQPSATTSPEVVGRVMSIHNKLMHPEDQHQEKELRGTLTGVSEQRTATRQQIDTNKVDVPSEFLDEVTFEVMAMPVLLPSGHNVDQLTLDKHNREQELWGRSPSDPFTGVTFSETSKPVPNAALKVRIDQFVLKCSSDIQISSRTLGTSEDRGASVAAVSSLVSGSRRKDVSNFFPARALGPTVSKNRRVSTISEPDGPAGRRAARVSTETPYTMSDRGSLGVGVTTSLPFLTPKVGSSGRKRKRSPESDLISTNPTTYTSTPVIDLTGDDSKGYLTLETSRKEVKRRQGFSRDSHENSLASNLDRALDCALSGLPSFSSSAAKDPTPRTNVCDACSEEFLTNNAYQLPCLHKMCRNCLTKQTVGEIPCVKCGQHCARNTIVKLHVSRI